MAPPGGARLAEADSPSAPAAKKNKPNQGNKRPAPKTAPMSALPGTAMDQGGGGGSGAEQGGNGVREVMLPNPTLSIHPHIRHYRKVHRFLTYGLAYKIISSISTTQADAFLQLMCTPLASVPWDKPYLYLSPAEFSVLPKGAHVSAVRVTVISRNVRIAFPTNEKETQLATLNQNRDLMYAIGLNKSCHTTDMAYKVTKMIPQSASESTRAMDLEFSQIFYGKGDTTTIAYSDLPYHQIGLPVPLPLYATIPHWWGRDIDEGWPCLQAYYRDMDADSMIGKELVSCEYKPKMGLLTTPHPAVYQTNFNGKKLSDYVVPRNGMRMQAQLTSVTADANDYITKKTETDQTMNVITDIGTNIYVDPIEKCQYVSQGIFGAGDTQAQDSLHIGIQPIQAITPDTTDTTFKIEKYTDSQAYFEVICEMEVNMSYPTPFPLYQNTHVTEHGATFLTGVTPNMRTKSMFNGLYVQ